MSYENKKIEFGKEHLYIVEIDLEYCGNTFSIAPCTATGTGDAKCHNTINKCQDLPNFTSTLKTYRFCESRARHPVGLDAIPSLTGVNISASQIDLAGGLGVRASASITFRDHPHSDIDIDMYVDERTYIASDRGSFWTKLRARNPNYQFKSLRVLSGYLEDGKYIASNFITRHYVIETMNVSGGVASITAKDPLKLASRKKALAPAPSNGLLSAVLTDVATSLTLLPVGIGSEYETLGFVIIGSEVMSFTRAGDVLTVVRGIKNTINVEHDANDTVQQCLEYSGGTRGKLDFIVKDLITNFANIDSAFINDVAWATEVGTYLSGLLEGIVTKPHDVFKLLIELAESMPHYLWWNEQTQEIELTSLKAPPVLNDVLRFDENITKGSFRTTDKPELRRSTVFVNFGMFDPTKKLDESNNFQQSYARIDNDSISKYGSSQVKTINSRWINNTNKATALQLAALIGRRFADVPREIRFSLDAKDSNVWLGQTKSIHHNDIVDDSGAAVDTAFQIMSAKESSTFNYTGLEFTYGQELSQDEGGGDPAVDIILISIDLTNANLRTIYDNLFPAPDGTTQAKFVIEGGTKVGSTSTGTFGIVTGSWPAGAIVTLQINSGGSSVGKGGDATATDGENGGHAIRLDYDLTIINNGIIGGGGGGGATHNKTVGPETYRAGGGGGAGFDIGLGYSSFSTDGAVFIVNGSNGTLENGGTLGEADPVAFGGAGGDLGQAGGNSASNTGGSAGDAIDKNGFVLTQTFAGDIRGAIIV